ncbi:MAG TPA: AIR synthase-related protein [Candidatus Paceibacterota bacterium]|nr:AIR synthase-related protein [Candidatus Paceibacterota bacterium]
MIKKKSEYAKAGVDYTVIEPFKMAMIEVGKKTLKFPNKRGVFINKEATHAHGAIFDYRGKGTPIWCQTQEDLGNKNWIAEWMYQKTGKSYYDSIAIDTALIVVNDVIAQGAMPVVFTDQIEASKSAWYGDKKRAGDFAGGFLKICREVGMALPAGESASVTYLINPKPPVKEIASLSGSVTGIVAPKENLITGQDLAVGDHIVGVASSGIHANGISLVIKKVLELPLQFLTKLPNGNTLGDEALIPTRSYVALIEALLKAKIKIHALLPGTGDGVGKIAFDKRPFTYRIHSWLKIPPLMEYFNKVIGIATKDCLKTFNWGVGYYLFVPKEEVAKILKIGENIGYELADIGVVEKGKRQVIFEPGKIVLTPPGK